MKKIKVGLIVALMLTVTGCGADKNVFDTQKENVNSEKSTETVKEVNTENEEVSEVEEEVKEENKLKDAKEFRNYMISTYLPEKYPELDFTSENIVSKYDNDLKLMLNTFFNNKIEDSNYTTMLYSALYFEDNELDYVLGIMYETGNFLDYIYTMDFSIASSDGDFLNLVSSTNVSDDDGVYTSDVGFLLTEEEINHLYEILGKEEVGYRVKAGVNSPEDIECHLSREVCDTLRKDIEVIKELQELRK